MQLEHIRKKMSIIVYNRPKSNRLIKDRQTQQHRSDKTIVLQEFRNWNHALLAVFAGL